MAEGEEPGSTKTGLSTPAKTKTKPTGRKGGTIFPRIPLQEALKYSKKLVSKTAIGSQPEQTVLAGVFGNSGGRGRSGCPPSSNLDFLTVPLPVTSRRSLLKISRLRRMKRQRRPSCVAPCCRRKYIAKYSTHITAT